MADRPVVSVVVPCFNHGRYLGEALASVGAPAVRTEIVVIDDGSTDATPEVVARFETRNEFRCVRQVNAGLAAARNRGLRESRGRYVIFLDADDRLAQGAVDLGASKLDEHPECAFVFGRCQMMDEAGVLLVTPEQPRIVRDHYRELLRGNYIWMPATVMFRRDTLDRIGGFNRAVNAAADYEMYLHIARHHPVHDHAQIVAHYRKHDANMSCDAGRMLRETLAVMRSQRPFLEGDDASLAAYEEGWRRWQDFYGAHLATEIRQAVRDHTWLAALTKAAILGWYHPQGLWHHARRKTQLLYAGRAIPAAEISAPRSRASSSPGKG
ncbi:MAG TPA: glycosyltransferase [Vicinamibacterales bacterium]|nr:glycosyltransferase [Vicinamibacterales bacterium]